MERYHVYKWIIDSYILIDKETNNLYFFSTNYKKMMGEYHLENPSTETISRQKITGLMNRIKKGRMNSSNSFVVDVYIYHLLMSEEQRENCGDTNYYGLDLSRQEFITSGNDFEEVKKNMRELVNKLAA